MTSISARERHLPGWSKAVWRIWKFWERCKETQVLTSLDEALNAEVSEDEDGWVVALSRGTTTAVRSGMTVTAPQLRDADAAGWSVSLVRLERWVEPSELIVTNVERVTTPERARDLNRRAESHGFPDREGAWLRLFAALRTWAGENDGLFF
jgi:hypothetical protein